MEAKVRREQVSGKGLGLSNTQSGRGNLISYLATVKCSLATCAVAWHQRVRGEVGSDEAPPLPITDFLSPSYLLLRLKKF